MKTNNSNCKNYFSRFFKKSAVLLSSFLIVVQLGCSNSLKYTKFEAVELDDCFFLVKHKSGIEYEPIIIISKVEHFIELDSCMTKIDDGQKNRIISLLETYDLIFTRSKIEDILLNSEYTERDGCNYWMKVMDIKLSGIPVNVVNVYGIKPKNKYRHVLCP